MHVEVERFLAKSAYYVEWKDADVVEVGAQDVNGATQHFVPQIWRSWTGIDLVDGPNIHHVGDAAWILPHPEEYDVAVSTEVMEHAANWRDIVVCMIQSVKAGGWIVITCAGEGRPPHGMNGGGLPPGEYYENVTLPDLVGVFEGLGCKVLYQEDGPPGDSRVIALRRPKMIN